MAGYEWGQRAVAAWCCYENTAEGAVAVVDVDAVGNAAEFVAVRHRVQIHFPGAEPALRAATAAATRATRRSDVRAERLPALLIGFGRREARR